jgi:ribosome-associated protein
MTWRQTTAMAEAEAAVERAMGLISESFIAAAGPGGQNVNKVATFVIVALFLNACF